MSLRDELALGIDPPPAIRDRVRLLRASGKRIAEIAADLDISPASLERNFRSQLRQGARDYVDRLALELAERADAGDARAAALLEQIDAVLWNDDADGSPSIYRGRSAR